jgi:hypothetical protein
MRSVVLTSLLALASTLKVEFRGLDSRYALLPSSLYYVRRAYACHFDVSTDAVQIVSGSYYNQTSHATDEVNRYVAPREVPCYLLAATHWSDTSGEDTDLQLYRDLSDEEPFTLTLNVVGPVGLVRPYQLNLLPYLAASVSDLYAPILHSVPHLFVEVGALPASMRPMLARLLGGDVFAVLSAVVILHLIGSCGLMFIARRASAKKRFGPRPLEAVITV